MEKLSQQTIEELLRNLDPLDVLELIDYHPESMQREGDLVHAWDPLSQDHSGRYLTVDLRTGEFVSEPPGIPRQRGNLIDLYARCRSIPLELAAQELADEFGVMLVEGPEADLHPKLMKEAADRLEKAKAHPDEKARHLAEADKRLRRVLADDGKNLAAHRLLHQLRLQEANPLTMVPQTLALMKLEKEQGNLEEAREAGRRHLEVSPNEPLVCFELAEVDATLGRNEEAVEELMRLADVAETSRQFDLAIRAYRRAQELGPDIVDVYPMLVDLLVAQQDRQGALREIDKRIDQLRESGEFRPASSEAVRKLEIKPDDPMTKAQIVELAVASGLEKEDYDQCLEHVDLLMEQEAWPYAARALRALLQARPKDDVLLEMLITTLRQDGAEEKELADLQLRLADVHRESGNAPAAYLILEELMQSGIKDESILRRMSHMLVEDGAKDEAAVILDRLVRMQVGARNFDGALESYQLLLAMEPERIDAWEATVALQLRLARREEAVESALTFARLCKKTGEYQRMRTVLEGILSRVPGEVELLQQLVGTYRQLGLAGKAADAEKQLGVALLEANDPAKAQESARKLLQADPANTQLYQTMAQLALKQDRRDDARKVLEEGLNYFDQKNDPEQLRLLVESLLEIDPEDPQLLGRLSDICAELGDEAGLIETGLRQMELQQRRGEYQGVLEVAELVLELRPEQEAARHFHFQALAAVGKTEEALDSAAVLLSVYRANAARSHERDLLREMLDLAPQKETLQTQYAMALASVGEEKELLDFLDKDLPKQQEDPEARVRVLREVRRANHHPLQMTRRLAQAYEAAGRHDDMVAEMQKLIHTQQEEGNEGEALRLYRELVEKAPESISTRSGLVALLKQRGDKAEALQHYLVLARQLRKARKLVDADEAYAEMYVLAPEDPDVFRGHAELLREMDQKSEAARKLRELSRLYARDGKTEMATATLRDALEIDPQNNELRRDIVRMKREEGKHQEAVQELEKLAMRLAEDGDEQGAISARREAVQILPDVPEVRLRLIRELEQAGRPQEAAAEQVELTHALVASKRYKEALKILEAALKLDEHNANALRARAKVYDAMGEEKLALEEYRRLQEVLDRVPSSAAVPISGVMARPEEDFGLHILPEYDFDSFVVGTTNNFAFATAKAVAAHPGSARNPLFLYSDVGLGKTHLLHAIANHMKHLNPETRIFYSSTEYFTSELIDAIQNNTVSEFRNKHRRADVFLLDDVQFLAGKERAQEEFFHIFNMLFQSRRQIVVTSDRPPKDISHLDMRLRSRFGQGVIVDIQPPDFETRSAILRADAERHHLQVPALVLEAVAERVSSNVRELKGAFNQVINQHELAGVPLTVENAVRIIDKYFVS